MIPLRVILGTLAIAAFTGSHALAETPTGTTDDTAKTDAQKEAEFKARYDRAQAALTKLKRDFGGRNAALEAVIRTEAHTVSDYLDYLGHPSIPELEMALMENPLVAAYYARSSGKRSAPEVVAAIARDASAAAIYAQFTLRRPWPEAEPVIFSNGNAAAWYAESFPERITAEARQKTESDPWGAALSATHAGVRMPGLEPVILRNNEAATHYAAEVLHARWPEAEVVIRKNPEAAAAYAAAVIHGRWPEAEETISQDRPSLLLYLRAAGPDALAKFVPLLLKPGTADVGKDFASAGVADLTPFLPELQKIPGALLAYHRAMSKPAPKDNPTLAAEMLKYPDTAYIQVGGGKKRVPEAEAALLGTPLQAANYAESAIRGRWPEAEPVIRSHAEAASLYAITVLKRRWPEAEPVILTNANATREYIRMFVHTPWPEAEPVLKTQPATATLYARLALKARFPEAEPAIAESESAAEYALNILKHRWPEAEPAIARDWFNVAEYTEAFMPEGWPDAVLGGIRADSIARDLYKTLPASAHAAVEKLILELGNAGRVADYAEYARKSRWPEGEALLLAKRHAHGAAQYAAKVIRGPWPEAEPFILKDPYASQTYIEVLPQEQKTKNIPTTFENIDSSTINFAEKLKVGRIPALETALLDETRNRHPSLLSAYAKQVIKGRWPEAEEKIIRNPELAANYAWGIIGGRWPEAEPTIMNDAYAARIYAQAVLRGRWPEAEETIMKDLGEATYYATEVLRERHSKLEKELLQRGEVRLLSHYHESLMKTPWPEAEPALAQSIPAALQYAQTTGRRFPAGEALIRTEARAAVDYAAGVLKSRWPEAEPAILADAEQSARYAATVIKGRWPEAEKRIAADTQAALTYVREVLCAPFPEAESLLARDAQSAVAYAKAIHARFPAGEPIIAKNASASVEYARILCARFPAGEPAILQSPQETLNYARALGKRFPEGEPTILKNAESAAGYATEIIRARWPEAESVIAQNPAAILTYNGYFPEAITATAQVAAKTAWGAFTYAGEQKKRFPEGEAAILADPAYIIRYAKEIIGGRWPEGEVVLRDDASLASAYAEEVIHGRWPEAEPAIRTKADPALRYAVRVLKTRWPEAEETLRRDAYAAAAYAGLVIGGRWPEAEESIRREPNAILAYALLAINGRWPEAEDDLRRNPSAAVDYALWIRRARWPEAESKMITGSRNIGAYLKSFVPGADAALEKLLLARMEEEARKPARIGSQLSSLCYTALPYVEISRRSRWPEVEPFLLGQTDYAIRYVSTGLGGARWPELENRIREEMRKKPDEFPRHWEYIRSYLSALNKKERPPEDFENLVLDKVFADAESSSNHYLQFGYDTHGRNLTGLEKRLLAAIAKHPEIEEWVRFAVGHAEYGRQTRWPELERPLSRYPNHARDYRMHFGLLKEPWPELEKALANDADYLKRYRDELNEPARPPHTPQSEPQPVVAMDEATLKGTLGNPYHAIEHVRKVIKGRWPAYEARLLAKPEEALQTMWQTGSHSTHHEPYSVLGSYVEATGQRCPELEHLLAKSPGDALLCARLRNAEFPEGEVILAKKPWNRVAYLEFFLNRGDARMDWKRLFAGGPENPFREAALAAIDFPEKARSGRSFDEPWSAYRWLNPSER